MSRRQRTCPATAAGFSAGHSRRASSRRWRRVHPRASGCARSWQRDLRSGERRVGEMRRRGCRALPVHGARARVPRRGRASCRPCSTCSTSISRAVLVGRTGLPAGVLRGGGASAPTSSSRSASSRRSAWSSCSASPPSVSASPTLGVDARGLRRRISGRATTFVLYPARGWKHKNHARLIEAMEIVRLCASRDAARAHRRRPRAPRRRCRIGSTVAGWCRGDELRGLYRRGRRPRVPEPLRGIRPAAARGHGVGCPVAASDAGSIPEVCGMRPCSSILWTQRAIAAGILSR